MLQVENDSLTNCFVTHYNNTQISFLIFLIRLPFKDHFVVHNYICTFKSFQTIYCVFKWGGGLKGWAIQVHRNEILVAAMRRYNEAMFREKPPEKAPV